MAKSGKKQKTDPTGRSGVFALARDFLLKNKVLAEKEATRAMTALSQEFDLMLMDRVDNIAQSIAGFVQKEIDAGRIKSSSSEVIFALAICQFNVMRSVAEAAERSSAVREKIIQAAQSAKTVPEDDAKSIRSGTDIYR